MQSVVQFSRIHHNPLFCNSRAKRITFFNLIQIHSDLLFYHICRKGIKMRNCPLSSRFCQFRREMKTSLRRLPCLPQTVGRLLVSITVARSQAKNPPHPQTPAPPGRFRPQQNNLEHTQGSTPTGGPGSREQFGT